MTNWVVESVELEEEVGSIIEKMEKDGWKLHTYTPVWREGYGFTKHYLLFKLD